MKIAFLALLGLFLGAILGGAVGTGVGLACVSIFEVSNFEGEDGMMVFLLFAPLGMLIGAVACAIWFGVMGARASRRQAAAAAPPA